MAKYGKKIVMVRDAGTKYMVYDSSDEGTKQNQTIYHWQSRYYVKSLTSTSSGANRNITMDNWNSPVKVADDLLQAPHAFSMDGTL